MSGTIFSTLWMSVTEGGFVAGIVAIILQFAEITGLTIATYFVLILLVLSITIFNIRLFYINRTQKPFVEYIGGHDEGFDYLTPYIKSAKNSIWVTRFSKGSIIHEHDYFTWTTRRITGDGCKPVYSYRRVMNVDSRDKAELVCDIISKAGKSNNFYLRKTELILFFEILIVDGQDAFFLLHEPGSTGTINAVLRISKPEMVAKVKEIYEAIWSNKATEIIKEGVLTDKEQENIINEYKELACQLH